MTFHIHRSSEFQQLFPQFIGGVITCSCTEAAAPATETLWQRIAEVAADLRSRYDVLSIRQAEGIRQTRDAYRLAGIDPSRYRPSCEQLARRLLQGKELFRVSKAVDAGNLISLLTGCSVGVIDRDQVVGQTVTLDLGRDDEPYEAIGRGQLHIYRMPVYRDAVGAFATPTSDSMRTRITPQTSRLLIFINAYHGHQTALSQSLHQSQEILQTYCQATNVVCDTF